MIKKVILGAGVIIILSFGGTYLGLVHKKIFKPMSENIERETFENTKSYVYGVVQDLAKYKHEWEKSDKVGKKAIENVVRMRFANFNPNKINNSELRTWFKNIMRR